MTKRNSTRIPILSLNVIACFFLPGVSAEESSQTSPPNVLFIAVDDLNDWVSPLEGHPQTITPNFDRLADQGTRFMNAHTPAPLCGPARAAIFTGRYPSNTGIYLHINDDNIKQASAAANASTLLTHYFVEHGYKTMGAGKLLHQGAGADLLEDYGGHKSFGPYPPQRLNYTPPVGGTSTDWGPYPAIDGQMPDYEVAKYAIGKLRETHDKPFFLGVGFNRPHVPWHVPQKWFDLIDVESVILPPYLVDDLMDAPEISRTIHEMPPTPTTEWLIEQGSWKDVVQAYLACVAFVDHQLGRVLDALEESQYADNTIVVLWSDHGYHLGEKNIVAKMTLYEESTHVPLIFAGPGTTAGGVCDRPVGLIDLYPTLLDLAGLPGDGDLDGRSLVPLLENPEVDWPYPALTFWGQNNTAVRTEQYRYIRYEDGSEELYDHFEDPNEWTNLAGNPATRGIRNVLAAHIPQPQVLLSNKSSFTWNEYWQAKTNGKRQAFDAELTWSNWTRSSEELVDTGGFFGYLHLNGDFVYVYAWNLWMYLKEDFIGDEGGWGYIYR